MAQKKFVSIAKLGTFLTSLRDTFAPLSHKHKLSDISDYKVDTALSSTSTNPVANKIVKTAIDGVNSSISSLSNNKANATDLTTHIANKANPHGVTKTQLGLGNVDNTSDINKPISKATQTALNNKSDSWHTHSYLPLSGGTVTGATTFNNGINLGEASLKYDSANKCVVISIN